MKKCRFLWSAHRITEKQKAGKARNIKGKRQLKNFNTVSKQLVVHHSSARDNLLLLMYIKPTDLMFVGFFNTINMVCLII